MPLKLSPSEMVWIFVWLCIHLDHEAGDFVTTHFLTGSRLDCCPVLLPGGAEVALLWFLKPPMLCLVAFVRLLAKNMFLSKEWFNNFTSFLWRWIQVGSVKTSQFRFFSWFVGFSGYSSARLAFPDDRLLRFFLWVGKQHSLTLYHVPRCIFDPWD